MSPKRLIVFRLTAVALSLSTFVVFEAVCRMTGWGASRDEIQAFAEFASVRPLFERNADDDRWHVAANRRLYFAEESFPNHKSANTFRIFVFGGSTVQGRPFSIPTSFPTFLKIGLQTTPLDVNWDVVNCGGISYASYRLLPLMQECLQHQPDLYIVCTGHNEFLECVTYSKVRQSSAMVKQSYAWLRQFHSFRLASDAWQPPPPSRHRNDVMLPEEVDAILDHQGGLTAYTRSALARDEVVADFDANLHDMVALTSSANVPLILVKPPSNLRDCPPFKSEFSHDVSEETQNAILQSLRNVNVSENSDRERLSELRAIVKQDEHFALSWYHLGQTLLQQNRFEEAHVAFRRARDEDICPLRMTGPLEAVLDRVAANTNTTILDAQQLLATNARHGIMGDATLVDHVHPSFRSNQQIAIAAAELLLVRFFPQSDNINALAEDRKSAAQNEFDRHLQSLDDLYFLRGRRTLKMLEAWTQGRADGPPLE